MNIVAIQDDARSKFSFVEHQQLDLKHYVKMIDHPKYSYTRNWNYKSCMSCQ